MHPDARDLPGPHEAPQGLRRRRRRAAARGASPGRDGARRVCRGLDGAPMHVARADFRLEVDTGGAGISGAKSEAAISTKNATGVGLRTGRVGANIGGRIRFPTTYYGSSCVSGSAKTAVSTSRSVAGQNVPVDPRRGVLCMRVCPKSAGTVDRTDEGSELDAQWCHVAWEQHLLRCYKALRGATSHGGPSHTGLQDCVRTAGPAALPRPVRTECRERTRPAVPRLG